MKRRMSNWFRLVVLGDGPADPGIRVVARHRPRVEHLTGCEVLRMTAGLLAWVLLGTAVLLDLVIAGWSPLMCAAFAALTVWVLTYVAAGGGDRP